MRRNFQSLELFGPEHPSYDAGMGKRLPALFCALLLAGFAGRAVAQDSSLNLRPAADLPVIETSLRESGGLFSGTEILREAVKLSKPLQTVESDSLDSGEEVSSDRTSSSVRISTDFLDRLHLNPLKNHGPVLRSKLEMDLESGGLGLQTVEMGFEDRKLWLIHTPSTDETEGTMGVELKLRW